MKLKNPSKNLTPNLTEKATCKAFYGQVMAMKAWNQFKNDFMLFHIANEQFTSRGYTLELMRMGMMPGVADYFCATGNRFGFLEFKRNKKCKLTPKQEEFKEMCAKLSIPYEVAYTIEDGVNWLHKLLN
jgi:galactokinase/mevalonate kinase-like predicted kinase